MEDHLCLLPLWYGLVVGLHVQGLGFGVHGSGFWVEVRVYRVFGLPVLFLAWCQKQHGYADSGKKGLRDLPASPHEKGSL